MLTQKQIDRAALNIAIAWIDMESAEYGTVEGFMNYSEAEDNCLRMFMKLKDFGYSEDQIKFLAACQEKRAHFIVGEGA